MLLPGFAHGMKMAVRLAGGEPLVGEMDGQAEGDAEILGEGLGLAGLRTDLAGHVERVANDDLGDGMLADDAAEGFDVGVGRAAMQGEERLHGQSEGIGDGEANAFAADVQGEQAWGQCRRGDDEGSWVVHVRSVAGEEERRCGFGRRLSEWLPGEREWSDGAKGGRMAKGASRGHSGGIVLLLVLLVVAAVAAWWLLAPFGPASETFIDIPSGSSTPRMAALLEEGGAVRSRYAFDLLRLAKGGRLKAGEYRFDHPASVMEIYNRVARGDVYTRSVVIPEGYNIFDVAHAVEAAGLGSATEFLAAERANTSLITDLAGGRTPGSLEGFLFPDTYRFSRHTTPAGMLGVMVKRFRQQTATLGLPADAMRTVTLASIVEKEVAQGAERPLVASVFENRLERGMPLQTDPTVIYAALLEARYRGTIYASDLKADSAYNTYRHTGLPPGPIASPGMAALRAVLHPPTTEYLYFVSDGAGHTKFSKTLGEHTEHVAALRQGARQ